MLGSWVLVGVGFLFTALGAMPWILHPRRAAIHNIDTFLALGLGGVCIVLGWMGLAPRSSRSGHVLLWIGVGLVLTTIVMWNFDNRNPEYKVGLFAIPWIPGLCLMLKGRATLLLHRSAGAEEPPKAV